MLSAAKINLGLNVLYKRPDNYHEIQSLFLKIHFGDEIHIESIPEKKLELTSVNELTGYRKQLYEEVSEKGNLTKNILYKTFQKALEFCPESFGLKIHLTKRIPPEGGLGGGSSNAAMVLSYLFSDPIFKTSNEINFIAKQIGADVPFFLGDGHALVTGIGDILEKMEVSKGCGVLAIPPYSINTKESYLNLKKPLQKTKVYNQCIFVEKHVLDELKLGNWSKLVDVLTNDFEDYAFQKFSELRQVKSDFYKFGSLYSSMSGSASCIYGLIPNLKDGFEIQKKMQEKYPDYKFVQFDF